MQTDASQSHFTRKTSEEQGGTAAALILLLLTLIFFKAQLFHHEALYWGDIGLYFTPMLHFLRGNLLQGRLPLWNPLMLCGAPYVGNPQTWPLYPFSVLLLLVSAPYFISLTIAFHVWLAGIGTWLFLRRALRIRQWPALLGAVTFMFSGWLIAKEQFPNMVQAASYLPWTLWAVTRTVAQKATLRDALLLGIILGLQTLAAHPQITLLSMYLGAAWGCYLLSPQISELIKSRDKTAWRSDMLPLAQRIGLAAAIALGLSAGQVMPTLQLFHDGWRQDMSFRIVNRFFLPLNQSANWLLPDLHGSPFFGNFTARGNFWETCCYVGWISFFAAIAGVIGAWRIPAQAPIRFWGIVFLVGFLMALGGGVKSVVGPYWLAYEILPGFRSFHDPARCLIWATFALATLAAAGLDQLPKRLRRAPFLGCFIVLLAFVDLAHFGQTIYPLAPTASLFPRTATLTELKNDPAMSSGQARFLAPDSPRVWQRFTSHRSYRQNRPRYVAYWEDTLTPNLPMQYGFADAGGYEPVTRRDTQKVVGKLESLFTAVSPLKLRRQAAAEAGMLSVKYVATDRIIPPEKALPGLAPLFSDPSLPPLYPNMPKSRVFLSQNLLWQPRARLMTASSSSANNWQPELITTDSPDKVAISARSHGKAIFVLADTDAPGWTATVNGQPRGIKRFDSILSSLPLKTAGTHHIVFRYRPITFLLGFYITLVTMASVIAALCYDRSRRRA